MSQGTGMGGGGCLRGCTGYRTGGGDNAETGGLMAAAVAAGMEWRRRPTRIGHRNVTRNFNTRVVIQPNYACQVKSQGTSYSLRSELLVAVMDVFRCILVLETPISATSNLERREYIANVHAYSVS